jgi:hypothetical protein
VAGPAGRFDCGIYWYDQLHGVDQQHQHWGL